MTSTLGSTATRHCPTCAREQLFEQPPCTDGHADCPEWLCTVCGFALFIGMLDPVTPTSVRGRVTIHRGVGRSQPAWRPSSPGCSPYAAARGRL